MDYDKPKIPIEKLMGTSNIVPMLDEDYVKSMGNEALQGYNDDRTTRQKWEIRNALATDLALQVMEAKTSPWQGAANIKFPLLTVAGLQYHARAYPTLLAGPDVVECRVIGPDPDGTKSDRAKRISTHMSWQCLEQDTDWEEEMDKAILAQAINGCVFVKTWFDPGSKKVMSRLVLPDDLVLNYYTKDLATSERYTHKYNLTANQIRQRELDGRFKELEPEPTPSTTQDNSQIKLSQDKRQGLTAPNERDSVTPYLTGEQYCWYDFDGDGFNEPYIVTFDIATGRIRRIVARYFPSSIKRINGRIYDITPVPVFSKIPFIPSPDGGYYDLGLGSLLYPLNESVNTILNQMLDAGTLYTLGGGFVGRGFKSKGGAFTLTPGEFYPVDAPGDDLRKNIMLAPVREPSAVLNTVLGFLVQYAERIVSTTDIQVGESPGQNQKARTTEILDANGQRVYTGIYKRTWRALKGIYDIRYALNANFIEEDVDYTELTTGRGAIISKGDYTDPSITVRPSADPYIVSDTQRRESAMLVLQNALQIPGHNRYQALRRVYKAWNIANVDQILPPPQKPDPQNPGKMIPAEDFPPMPNPKVMEAERKMHETQIKEKQFQADMIEMKIKLQLEVSEIMATVQKLEAETTKLLAEAKSEGVEPQIKILFATIEAEKGRQDKILKMVEMITKQMEASSAGKSAGATGKPNGAGVGGLEAQSANASLLAGGAGLNLGAPGGMVQ